MSLPSLSDDQTAEALTRIITSLIRHQQSAARGDTGPTEFQRLNDADRALWRCTGCGGWRYGSRDCAVCPRIVEVAA